ncbi:MAG: hypothetical protein C1943_11315 [Halochromatium sp.]|nr:hypothetical protein [Halochromatium sp.]
MAAQDYITTVQSFYVAYYGRWADVDGLSFWTRVLDAAGGNQAEMINAFGASQEYLDTYAPYINDQGQITDPEGIITAVYNTMFDRDPDAAGLAFYVDLLESGGASFPDIVLDIFNGAQNTDLIIINNKVAAASYATNVLIETGNPYTADDIPEARTIIAGVDETPTSVVEAQNAARDFIEGSDNPGQTFMLTTGVDVINGTNGNDTFDGSVNDQGIATFTSVDTLNGLEGTDLLIGGLTGQNVAAFMTNIENVELIDTGTSTFDLVNTSGIETIKVRNSTTQLTINNLPAATTPAVTIENQNFGVNLNFVNAALAGTADDVTVTLSNVTNTTGKANVNLTQLAGTNNSGVETITLNSVGVDQNFLQSLTGKNGANNSTFSTLNVVGTQGLNIAIAIDGSVNTVAAGTLTGGLNATFNNTTADMSVAGGTGDDSIGLNSNVGNVTASLGAGDDMLEFSAAGGFNTKDTVNGGEGTDNLSVVAADAEAVNAPLANISNIEILSLNTVGTGGSSINATRFGEIGQVNLTAGTAGAYGVTLGAGARAVNVGGTLGGTLTVNDTGAATDDVLTLTNTNTAAVDTFIGQNLNLNGFETTNLSTGSTVTAAQTLGKVDINGDSTTGNNTLNLSGVNALNIGNLASNASGLLTVDASGMTNNAFLTMAAAPTFTGGVTGTVSLVGSSNDDTLRGHATASSTVDGGAGDDVLFGGSGVDNLIGGDGDDRITTNGGNDVVTGGAGNDTITVTNAQAKVNVDGGTGNDTVILGDKASAAGSTVNGGEGVDTLVLTRTPTAGESLNTTNFEILNTTVNQNLVNFTNNPGFTRVNFAAAGNIAITNASATVDTIGVVNSAGGTFAFERLVDSSNDSLTIRPNTGAAQTVATLTLDHEDQVTVDTGTTAGDDLTITNLAAKTLDSLTVVGSNTTTIGTITGGSSLAAIDASAALGAVTINASTSTANMTVTGATNAANTLTTGTGADAITGGVLNDVLSGNNGADTIDGGAGDDTLNGDAANDVITGGIGNDTITGGSGNDNLTGGAGADDFVFTPSNGRDVITDFTSGTDDLNISGLFAGAFNPVTVNTPLAGALAMADNDAYIVSFNGAAANLIAGGTATLTTADMTAVTLTSLAAYLNEGFAPTGTLNDDAVFAINWTAGGSTSSFVYDFVDDGDGTIEATELTLLATVQRGINAIDAGDLI